MADGRALLARAAKQLEAAERRLAQRASERGPEISEQMLIETIGAIEAITGALEANLAALGGPLGETRHFDLSDPPDFGASRRGAFAPVQTTIPRKADPLAMPRTYELYVLNADGSGGARIVTCEPEQLNAQVQRLLDDEAAHEVEVREAGRVLFTLIR